MHNDLEGRDANGQRNKQKMPKKANWKTKKN
jgi:hypothetical protein